MIGGQKWIVHRPFIRIVHEEERGRKIDVRDRMIVSAGGGIEGVRAIGGIDERLCKMVRYGGTQDSRCSLGQRTRLGDLTYTLPRHVFENSGEGVRRSVSMRGVPNGLWYTINEADHIVFPISIVSISPCYSGSKSKITSPQHGLLELVSVSLSTTPSIHTTAHQADFRKLLHPN